MFATYDQLRRKTPRSKLNRADYLQSLVNEFQDTDQEDLKEQVLANLANFSYDPINYNRLRDLKVPHLFIDCIENDEKLNGNIVAFAIGGICNLATDPLNRDIIVDDNRAISLITRCLSSDRVDTLLSALSTLVQLITPTTKSRIWTRALVATLHDFCVTSPHVRVKTLAAAILQMSDDVIASS